MRGLAALTYRSSNSRLVDAVSVVHFDPPKMGHDPGEIKPRLHLIWQN